MKNLFLGVAAVAAMMFVACSDDSSTSANEGDETATSSSTSVILSSSNEGSSAAIPSSSSTNVILNSSSSVILSSSEGSSAATPTSSSTNVILNSSSSVILSSSEGSSAVTSSSSSSVIPGIDPESPSSSSIKTASSSSSMTSGSSSSGDASESSSSVYSHTSPLYKDSLRADAYKVFEDSRDGRKYYYLTINGEDSLGNAASVTVMAENLNVGEMVLGTSDLADDSKIEKYCYNDDTTNCDEFGALYQWAEMMQFPSECNTKSCADQIKENHQGICPDGWRLLTYADFYIVLHSNGNDAGIKGLRSQYGFSGFNYSGYSLVGAGLRNYEDGSFESLTEYAFWYYPEEPLEYPLKGRCNSTYRTSTSGPSKRSYQTKLTGFSVRCVKAE